jgi:sec-independent protein translocase protein TatA
MFSSVLLFFEFTAPEIMLILFVVLLLFGGEKLPGLAKGLGKGIREFKDASEGVKREITNQIDTFQAKKDAEAAAVQNLLHQPKRLLLLSIMTLYRLPKLAPQQQ